MGLIELSDKFPVHLFSSFFHLRWATVSKHSKIYESWKPNPSSLCFLLSSTPKSELSCLIKLQYEYIYPTTYVLLVNAYIALEKINSCKISSFCSLFFFPYPKSKHSRLIKLQYQLIVPNHLQNSDDQHQFEVIT